MALRSCTAGWAASGTCSCCLVWLLLVLATVISALCWLPSRPPIRALQVSWGTSNAGHSCFTAHSKFPPAQRLRYCPFLSRRRAGRQREGPRSLLLMLLMLSASSDLLPSCGPLIRRRAGRQRQGDPRQDQDHGHQRDPHEQAVPQVPHQEVPEEGAGQGGTVPCPGQRLSRPRLGKWPQLKRAAWAGQAWAG